MEVALQRELFPLVEQRSERNSALRDFLAMVDLHGPLVPRWLVPRLVEFSRQRLHQLIGEGRIAQVVIHDHEFVPLASLEMFLADERKNGRPVKEKIDLLGYREKVGGFQRPQKKS